MPTSEPRIEVFWTGRCTHCATDWDILDEDLRAAYPHVTFPEEAFVADCSCGQDVELSRMQVKTFPYANWDVLPPAAGLCPECAIDHPDDLPHDLGSMHYQYFFRSREAHAGREERWPTWLDAMAHCEPDVRTEWIEKMADLGHILHDDGTVTVLDV